jgi:hypothetical protein
MPWDSDEEPVDDLEFDRATEGDAEDEHDIDDDILDTAEGDPAPEDVTDGDDVSLVLVCTRSCSVLHRILCLTTQTMCPTTTTTKSLNSQS